MRISLILPVYNVELYLARCLDSCLSQDLPSNEYEVIVVNDGSKDKSKEIAELYSCKNINIKIIDKQNGGLSDARNSGLKHAKGEYVWFIDSDDYIAPNSLGGIVKELTNNKLDALWLRWHIEDESHRRIPLYDSTISKEDNSVYTGLDFMENVMGIYYFAWSFVYRRDFLNSNKLIFKVGLYYEDSDFAFRALPLTSRIKLYNQDCYAYSIRRGSIAQTISIKKIDDLLYVAQEAISAHKQYPEYRCFPRAATNLLVATLLQSINIKYNKSVDDVKSLMKTIGVLTKCGSRANRMIISSYNYCGFYCAKLMASMVVFAKRVRQNIKKS